MQNTIPLHPLQQAVEVVLDWRIVRASEQATFVFRLRTKALGWVSLHGERVRLRKA
jgi:hypothetical protein